MKLKIISGGDHFNTKVVDADSGKMLECVREVNWSCKVGELAEANLRIANVEVDIIGTIKRKLFWEKKGKKKIAIQDLIAKERMKE